MGETAGSGTSALVDAALAGDRLATARLLTAVENRTTVAEVALRQLYPLAGQAHLVGITGPPGAGKSTLVAALIAEVRKAGRTVAVIAVDPSSPITGGALLGDRVRMQAYAEDRDVFIRSMAARGHAGGLASTSSAAAAVLDACGFDLLLIETVGTGQSEVEVAAAADTTVVLEAPEMGDEVQAIKAGLLEVADLVVVNKGDKPGAARTAAQLRAMLMPTTARGAPAEGAAARDAGAVGGTQPVIRFGPAPAEAPRCADHDRLDRGGRARTPGRTGPASDGGSGCGRFRPGAAGPGRGPGLGDPGRATACIAGRPGTADRHGTAARGGGRPPPGPVCRRGPVAGGTPRGRLTRRHVRDARG